MKFEKTVLIFFLAVIAQSKNICAQIYIDIKKDTSRLIELKKNEKLTTIGGIYIPKDLSDAFDVLDNSFDAKALQKFKTMTEEDARTKTHFSFGKWMNSRWMITDGSRLTAWFRLQKIYNPDDMIDCIIVTYHRKLNNLPLEFDTLSKYYYEKRKKIAQEETAKRIID